MRRAAGVLLHPTCLPGRFGIGDVGPVAEQFIDWLARAGQTYWQILPLGPVDDSGSPYRSYSAFAGNALLISPERLLAQGLLAPADLEPVGGDQQPVDFLAVRSSKTLLLRKAWARTQSDWSSKLRLRFDAFCDDNDVRGWLDDWTLYAALKDHHDGAPWYRWPDAVRDRDDSTLNTVRQELASEIDFHRFTQFLFFDQWGEVRATAERLGVRVLGDLAIYVSPDSADVWSNQKIFDLDPNGMPRTVAGVPPDYFSATGQRWGNPLYRWDRLESSGFDWWIRRLEWSLRQVDLLRLDHFRGFADYWEIPAKEKTAVRGQWRPGPGMALFAAVREALGELPMIAEDLGVITEDVTALRKAAGLPGMRVLQFAFADHTSNHRPHGLTRDTVFYTGTHDNDTVQGWLESASDEERQRALDYVGRDGEEPAWRFVRAVFTSIADTAIAPLQDVLGLGSDARLNTPAEASGQWSWRLAELPASAVAERLRRLTTVSGRLVQLPADAGKAQR